RGRKRGRIRRTVLEVVARHPDALYAVAAWGDKAQWLRTVRANPEARVHIGFYRSRTTAPAVDEGTGSRVLAEYAARHPRAFRALAGRVLDDAGDTPQETVGRMAAVLPVVELPRS